MTRSFRPDPIDAAMLRGVLDLGRRVPSAGHAQGAELLVLVGPEQTARYWAVTMAGDRRDRFAFPGLLQAPVLVVVYASPDAYLQRYSEIDKVGSGRGAGRDAWPQPFWTIDAAFVALGLQLAAVDAGLGVLFFGVFDHASEVAEEFGVPAACEVIGTVAMGWAEPAGERTEPRPGQSAGRGWRPLDEVTHFGAW